MSHVLMSETGMVFQLLMRILETKDGLMVIVLWLGLPESGNTMEALVQIYEDVPQEMLKLLRHKNVPADLVDKARRELHLS